MDYERVPCGLARNVYDAATDPRQWTVFLAIL